MSRSKISIKHKPTSLCWVHSWNEAYCDGVEDEDEDYNYQEIGFYKVTLKTIAFLNSSVALHHELQGITNNGEKV